MFSNNFFDFGKNIVIAQIKLQVRKPPNNGSCIVNPKYVGNGLQFQMLEELDKLCLKQGYKYVAATIHPENIYSINNLVKDNFINIDKKELRLEIAGRTVQSREY